MLTLYAHATVPGSDYNVIPAPGTALGALRDMLIYLESNIIAWKPLEEANYAWVKRKKTLDLSESCK